MPQEALNPIVQRMIDAGESEDNIATVIQHYAKQAPGPSVVSPDEPGTYAGGFIKSIKDQATAAVPTLAKGALNTLPAIGALVGGVLSTPETGGVGTIPGIALGAGVGRGARDLIGHATGLDAPSTPLSKAAAIGGETAGTAATAAILPGLLQAARSPIQTLREGAEQFGSAMPHAVRRLGRLFPSLPAAPARIPIVDLPGMEASAAPTAEAAPAAAASSVDDLLRARGLDPSRVVSMTPNPGAKATPFSGPRPTMNPMAPLQPVPEAPLQQPRVQTGAEAVGRPLGLTKEQVRAQTAPVLGEAQGAASPILPREPLGRIVDALKALPPGPEREAYVARATSGKAQWQIENIRRTLEHLGLVVPVAAAAPSLRDRLTSLIRGDASQP